MVKSLVINPVVRQMPGRLRLPPIRINQYTGSVVSELQSGRFLNLQTAVRIYFDMYLGRKFEEALQDIKTTSKFNFPGESSLEFDYGGPAHLRIGQEADAVGKTFLLKPDDLIFGSHGSHLEVIAKALSAIHNLKPAESIRRIEAHHNGELLSITSGINLQIPPGVQALGIGADQDRAIDAILYGLAAEIFCKNTGFNRGLGGSMHAFFLPFGIGPNNAIVGSSANIAAGAAYAELVNNYQQERGPRDFFKTMFNIGDGAAARGPVLETLNFIGMAQIKNFWNLGVAGLPLIAHFVDNAYGMGGQTTGETAAYGRLVELFYGERPDGYHAETINGNDPLAVIDFYLRNLKKLDETGAWPLGVHSETYRLSGHSPSDAGRYRTSEEVAAWKRMDPIELYKNQLINALRGLQGFENIETIIADIEQYAARKVYHAMRLATDPAISPPFGAIQDSSETLERVMFNTGTSEPPASKVGRDILIPLGQHPQFKKITGKYKSDPATVTFCDALTLAIMQRAVRDRRLVIYGEDVRDWGGAFAVTRDLDQLLPHHRLFNTPISEDTIVGSAVGAAMRGLRPLVEIMYFDFLGCAGEALINQLAKWQGMSAGEIRLPVGVRVSVGSKYGAQHSQDLFSMLYGVPGLYLAYPATPFDAKTMLTALLNQDNPFVISESQKDYNRTTKQILEKFGLRIEVPPLEETGCFIGDPQVVREGQDFTLLAFGPALYTAALAALELEKLGYSAEVINGKWLAPFNFAPVIRSVEKTGQLILVAEAPGRGSHISSLAGDFSRLAFDLLDAPVGTVGSMNTVTPGWSAQQNFFPSPSTILDEIHANRPLKNYQPQTDRRHSTLEDKRYHGI